MTTLIETSGDMPRVDLSTVYVDSQRGYAWFTPVEHPEVKGYTVTLLRRPNPFIELVRPRDDKDLDLAGDPKPVPHVEGSKRLQCDLVSLFRENLAKSGRYKLRIVTNNGVCYNDSPPTYKELTVTWTAARAMNVALARSRRSPLNLLRSQTSEVKTSTRQNGDSLKMSKKIGKPEGLSVSKTTEGIISSFTLPKDADGYMIGISHLASSQEVCRPTENRARKPKGEKLISISWKDLSFNTGFELVPGGYQLIVTATNGSDGLSAATSLDITAEDIAILNATKVTTAKADSAPTDTTPATTSAPAPDNEVKPIVSPTDGNLQSLGEAFDAATAESPSPDEAKVVPGPRYVKFIRTSLNGVLVRYGLPSLVQEYSFEILNHEDKTAFKLSRRSTDGQIDFYGHLDDSEVERDPEVKLEADKPMTMVFSTFIGNASKVTRWPFRITQEQVDRFEGRTQQSTPESNTRVQEMSEQFLALEKRVEELQTKLAKAASKDEVKAVKAEIESLRGQMATIKSDLESKPSKEDLAQEINVGNDEMKKFFANLLSGKKPADAVTPVPSATPSPAPQLVPVTPSPAPAKPRTTVTLVTAMNVWWCGAKRVFVSILLVAMALVLVGFAIYAVMYFAAKVEWPTKVQATPKASQPQATTADEALRKEIEDLKRQMLQREIEATKEALDAAEKQKLFMKIQSINRPVFTKSKAPLTTLVYNNTAVEALAVVPPVQEVVHHHYYDPAPVVHAEPPVVIVQERHPLWNLVPTIVAHVNFGGHGGHRGWHRSPPPRFDRCNRPLFGGYSADPNTSNVTSLLNIQETKTWDSGFNLPGRWNTYPN